MGKLATEDLKKLLSCIKPNPNILVAPKVGYDAGVHRIGEHYIAVATDPCMGVPEEWFGYLLVNYAASDVSLFGAKPEFCTITLLGPRPTAPERFQKIMQQVCTAAHELGIGIVRGHTGMYDSISEMVGVCTTYGTVTPEKLITPGNAKSEDLILCTKPIGLETAVNFAITYKTQAQKLFGTEKVKSLSKLVYLQSCVKEALQLVEVGGVHAMHDATEGGVITALNEMAEASNVGFKVDWELMPFCHEAQVLKDSYGLSDTQLLSMSSTGTILAAINPKAKEKVEQILIENGFQYGFVGKFTKTKKHVLNKNRIVTQFPKTADDPYTMILSGTV